MTLAAVAIGAIAAALAGTGIGAAIGLNKKNNKVEGQTNSNQSLGEWIGNVLGKISETTRKDQEKAYEESGAKKIIEEITTTPKEEITTTPKEEITTTPKEETTTTPTIPEIPKAPTIPEITIPNTAGMVTGATGRTRIKPPRTGVDMGAIQGGTITGNKTPSTNEEKDQAELPTIEDKTDENINTEINNFNINDWLKWAEEQQKKQWEREDNIRKETQSREDSAYQRAITDAKKAGINPNLMNIEPAQSGGGITHATNIDMSAITGQMDIDLKEMQQIIDNAFKEDENKKDRLNDLFGNIISALVMAVLFKKKK
jgi:hypothetical protein